MAPALDQLIAAHDATHREYARAIARGDKDGAAAANRDLANLGEQMDDAARNTVVRINQQLSGVRAMEPTLQQKARTLGSEAVSLGRLAREKIDNSVRRAELEQSSEMSRAAISATQAAFILFVTMAVAFVTGWHKSVIAIGILVVMALYKPFSASVRWQKLFSVA